MASEAQRAAVERIGKQYGFSIEPTGGGQKLCAAAPPMGARSS